MKIPPICSIISTKSLRAAETTIRERRLIAYGTTIVNRYANTAPANIGAAIVHAGIRALDSIGSVILAGNVEIS